MIRSSGDFPWLKTDDYFEFPDAESVDEDGIVGVGGNLSPGMLLSAYRQGVFPWFSPDDPIIWWSPDPRFVLMVAEIHVSRSMNKLLKAGSFSFTVDRAFSTVIRACASAPRKGQSGTWITEDMELGYCRLHELGYAHSCEVWQADQLVGGLYGVCLGRMFFGESMFSAQPNASKAALITFGRALGNQGFDVIDAQLYTPHVQSLGGRSIPRGEFLDIVRTRVERVEPPVPWADLLNYG